jgi:hypothetical protein
VPIGFLRDAERERLDGFPTQIAHGDIETYFTLSRSDRARLAWLQQSAAMYSPPMILATLEKRACCHG